MTKRCRTCGLDKDESEFNRRSNRRNGLQTRCRGCNSAYLKQHYREHLAYYRDKARRNRLLVLERNHRRVREYFATHPCVDCGEADPVVLQFDHVRGTKSFTISNLMRSAGAWDRVEAEIAKCDVRCSNCHWRKTAKQFNWYAYLRDDEAPSTTLRG